MAKPREVVPVRPIPLLLIGILVYLGSWLVPVCHVQQFASLGGGSSSVSSGPDWLPGWQACRYAWDMLTESKASGGKSRRGLASRSKDWREIALGATCLTNLVMLATIAAVLLGARPRSLAALLFVCAFWNTTWLYLGGGDMTKALRAGYFMWLGSFALTGFGLLFPRDGEWRS